MGNEAPGATVRSEVMVSVVPDEGKCVFVQ